MNWRTQLIGMTPPPSRLPPDILSAARHELSRRSRSAARLPREAAFLRRDRAVREGFKVCSVCKVEKETLLFAVDLKKPTGISSTCRSCARTRTAVWREANPERHRKHMQDQSRRRRRKRETTGIPT